MSKRFSEQTVTNSEKSCTRDCMRACNQIRYSINLVGSRESTTANSSSEEPVRALYQTQVNLAWGSFEYFRLQQHYKFSNLEEFFAGVGGALGIWLGLSILSLIQVCICIGIYIIIVLGHWLCGGIALRSMQPRTRG